MLMRLTRRRIGRPTKFSLVLAVAGILAPATVGLAAEPADAPLARHVPNNALLYVGWAGSDAVGEQFEGTHTQALLEASNLPEAFGDYLPQLLSAIAREQPEAAPAIEAINEIGPILWRNPTALAFGGINWNPEIGNGQPLPRVMLICDAGEDAAALRARLNQLFQQIEKPGLAFFVKENDGRVYFAMGFSEMDLAQLANGEGPSLAADGTFGDIAGPLLGGIDKGLMETVYVDVPGILAVVKEGIRRDNPDSGEQQIQQVEQIVNALGLDGIGHFAYANGFAGENYRSAAFLELSGERRGLTRLLAPAGSSLDEAVLNAIPANATLAAGSRFELDQLIDVIRNLVITFNPDQAQQFEQGLGFASQMAGANLEQDLFGQLGSSWGAYVSPNLGNSLLGGVVVNAPKEPEALNRALRGISMNTLNVANAQLRGETEGWITLPGRNIDLGDGATAWVLNLPGIAPTWLVDDEKLMLGFYPQSIMAARATEGESFAGTQAWAEMNELAEGNAINGFTYADLPELASDSYPGLLMFSQLVFGAGDLVSGKLGVQPPVVVLPAYPTVAEHVTPAAAVQWTDDRGIHYRAIEPFPFSGLLASDTQSSLGSLFQFLGGLGGALGERNEVELERIEEVPMDPEVEATLD